MQIIFSDESDRIVARKKKTHPRKEVLIIVFEHVFQICEHRERYVFANILISFDSFTCPNFNVYKF